MLCDRPFPWNVIRLSLSLTHSLIVDINTDLATSLLLPSLFALIFVFNFKLYSILYYYDYFSDRKRFSNDSQTNWQIQYNKIEQHLYKKKNKKIEPKAHCCLKNRQSFQIAVVWIAQYSLILCIGFDFMRYLLEIMSSNDGKSSFYETHTWCGEMLFLFFLNFVAHKSMEWSVFFLIAELQLWHFKQIGSNYISSLLMFIIVKFIISDQILLSLKKNHDERNCVSEQAFNQEICWSGSRNLVDIFKCDHELSWEKQISKAKKNQVLGIFRKKVPRFNAIQKYVIWSLSWKPFILFTA